MDDRTAAPELSSLATEFWDAYLEAHPLYATAVGDVRFDDRVPDPTPEGRAAIRDRLAGLLARVEQIDAGTLGEHDWITHSALRETLGAVIADLDTRIADWTIDPLEGVPAGYLNVPDYQRLTTPADGDRMVARWRAMAAATDAHLATLRRSLADGRVACRAPAERTVAILEGLLGQDSTDWPLLRPLAGLDRLMGWTTADRERFAASLRAAVEDDVRPAFGRLRAGLVAEILPASRPAARPGISHVPGGSEAYGRLIRAHTSLEVSADELHQIGLDEIGRIDHEIAELAGRVLGTGDLAQALDRLRSDPALYFATPDEVFRTAEDSLARAAEAIPGWFGRLPQAPCVVVPMGRHEEEHSTIAYYRQPAADGSRPGQYFINTSQPETRPRYEAEALAYHESIPGHHLQLTIGQELTDLPEFRRHLGPTAFVEGWGLYTERLSDEMGLFTSDLDRIGVLSFDAWRAARLVVDTGMHAFDWPRGRAIEFMLAHTALAPNNIANEVDRYIAWPGQALAYKTGQLAILGLRREAHAALGDAFDVRAFHDAVLTNGALALPTLRAVIEAWVADGTGGPGA